MRAIVVVPTFNEKDNIADLIPGVLAADPNIHIVIVDDRSPDGTADAVKRFMAESPRVHLIEHEPKGGRGFADRAGMRYALDHGFDVILQMDADLSHPPKYLPAFLKAIQTHDVVIGSRLVSGGRIEGRNPRRNILTTLANAYIRFVLGLKVKDCTSGYRAYRRDVLEKICMDEMTSPGPGLLEETLEASHRAGFSITEIPITFVDRTKGASKLTIKELWTIAGFVLKLRNAPSIPLFQKEGERSERNSTIPPLFLKRGLGGVLFLLALMAFAAYACSLTGDFVWDDHMNIDSNIFIQDWKNFPLIFTRQYLTSPDQLHLIGQQLLGAGEASYRPVVTMTYFLDFAVWKLNPFGYHLTNVILHILCGWCVYILIEYFLSLGGVSAKRHPERSEGSDTGILHFVQNDKGLLRDDTQRASFWAALLFLFHPVQTEAVMAISMREDLLSALFYLLTLIFYIKAVHDSPHLTSPTKGGGIKKSFSLLGGGIKKSFSLLGGGIKNRFPFLRGVQNIFPSPLRGGLGWGLITYALALFSKEMAVTLVVMLWIIDVISGREKVLVSLRGSATLLGGDEAIYTRLLRSLRSLAMTVCAKRYWGFYIVTLVYLYIWKFVMGRPEGFYAGYPGGSFYMNILTMIKVMGIYAQWLFMPWTVKPTLTTGDDFAAMFFWSPGVAESLLALLCAALVISVASRKMPLMTLAALWFGLTLLPVLNIIPLQNIYAPRFLYLPMVGIGLGAGLMLKACFEKKFSFRPSDDFLAVSLGALVLFFGVLIYTFHFRWTNEVTFRMAMVRDYPLHLSSRVGLAHAYRNQAGNWDLAIEQFLIAKTIDPSYLNTFVDLAVAYEHVHNEEAAIRTFQEALRYDPLNTDVHNVYCSMQGNLGRLEEAAACFEDLLRIDPHFAGAYRDLQRCYLFLGRPRKAALVGIRAIWHSDVVKKRWEDQQ